MASTRSTRRVFSTDPCPDCGARVSGNRRFYEPAPHNKYRWACGSTTDSLLRGFHLATPRDIALYRRHLVQERLTDPML